MPEPGDKAMQKPEPDNELAKLRNEVVELKNSVEALKDDVSTLVAAWKAGSLMLNVVKFAAGIASAIAIVWASFHGNNPH